MENGIALDTELNEAYYGNTLPNAGRAEAPRPQARHPYGFTGNLTYTGAIRRNYIQPCGTAKAGLRHVRPYKKPL